MAIIAVEETDSEPYAGGRSFGATGPYTLRRLALTHEVDPLAAANAAIVDLEHAERDDNGRVRFTQDVLALTPADGAGNGRVLVDVVNRGRPTAFRFLNHEHSTVFPPPPIPEPGDGHLLDEGWTVLFAGWQFDVDHPSLIGLDAPEAKPDGVSLVGPMDYTAQPPLDTDRLRLALPGHRPAAAVDGPATMWETGPDGLVFEEVDRARWSFDEAGRYALKDDGFRAGRRYRICYTTVGSLVAGCGLLALRDLAPWAREANGAEVVVLFGVSQCGRVIRQFLADGLNVDEQQRRAYDGAMPLIAGGRIGQFNQRFANPGILPMGTEGLTGPITYDELLAGTPIDARPKIMVLNTSTEYWRGDAALVHEGTGGNVRVHLAASTQHSPGMVPQQFADDFLGTKGQAGFSVVDYGPINRALLDQLVQWIEDDIEPAPSSFPGPELLSDRNTVLTSFSAKGWAVPDEASFGEPSGPVSAVDDYGNEIGGIRLPDVRVPLGVHTGWNLRHEDCGAPTFQLLLRGTTKWLSTAELTDRYGDEAGYLAEVDEAIGQLIAERSLREADRTIVRDHAAARWAEAMAQVG